MADDTKHRICTACNTTLPIQQFSRIGGGADGHRRQCTKCRAAANKRNPNYTTWNKRAADRVAARGGSRLARYGLTLKGFNQKLQEQGGVCAICSTDPTNGTPQRWHVDHCHETRAVRAILCHACNAKLAAVEDAGFLHRALEYLRAHRLRIQSDPSCQGVVKNRRKLGGSHG